MTEHDKHNPDVGNRESQAGSREVDWNIKLDFDLPNEAPVVPSAPPPPPKIPPRVLLKNKFPRILDRVELLWGTKELHNYFGDTLFTERSGRQGFPDDVMEALSELHVEHTKYLKGKGVVFDDVWDMLFRR